MTARDKLYTADDLWMISQLPENAGKYFELCEGAVVEMAPTGETRGVIASVLTMLILGYVREHGLGRVTTKTGYHPEDDTANVFAPDLAFTRKARLLPIQAGFVPQMPDLAVEIKSPHDSYKAMGEKAARYVKHGTACVWLIYPETRMVEVFSSALPTPSQMLDATMWLDGGDLLPTFRVLVSTLFEE